MVPRRRLSGSRTAVIRPPSYFCGVRHRHHRPEEFDGLPAQRSGTQAHLVLVTPAPCSSPVPPASRSNGAEDERTTRRRSRRFRH